MYSGGSVTGSTGRRRRRHLAFPLVRVELIPVLIPLALIVFVRAAGGETTVKYSRAIPTVIKSHGANMATADLAAAATVKAGEAPPASDLHVVRREEMDRPAVEFDIFMGYPPYSRDPHFFALASPAGGVTTVKSNGVPMVKWDGAKIVRSDAAEAAANPDGGATADNATTVSDSNYVFRQGYVGHGTTHEQLGQKHWPSVEYTDFRGKAMYSLDLASTTKALSFVYNLTHFIYDLMITNSPALPPGYVVATADEKLVLGPKVIQNDWAALLDRYWLLLLFVLFLLAWIIVIPFAGICYCCLCCCLRCKQGCAQCTATKDFRWRMYCGICLFLMILGLILGLFIAFVANRFVDRGFREIKQTLERSTDDTCVFLKNVAEHIHHLMVFNYQELESYLDVYIKDVPNHIFLDLMDVSEGNSLVEMERILDNMPKAYQLMKQVDVLEKEMRFLGSQLKDGLRGMKRTISYASFWLCPYRQCYDFAHNNRIQEIDTSSCLHFDLIPNTTVFVRAMKKIIKDRDKDIPKRGLVRLNKIKVKISKQLNLIVPGLTKSISDGRLRYWEKATAIRDMIESVINELHLSTVSSTKTFDDVYDMFGPDRSAVNQILIISILIIIVILSTALICGCFGSTRRAPGRSGFCSKGMAATCLLIAIILIFCVFSFIALVGLFYMMIGTVTHEAACNTAHSEDGINLFRQIDTLFDLNRFKPRNGDDEMSSRTLSVSNSVRACYANESIFGLLIAKNVFNINDLRSREILVSVEESVPVFTEDFSQLFLLTTDEKIKLNEIRKANMSEYHSILYDKHLCTKFLHTDMNVLANKLYSMTKFLDANAVRSASFSFKLDFLNAQQYQEHLSAPLRRCVNKMLEKLKLIDSLILLENQNFEETIKTLLDAVERSEKFVQVMGTSFINILAKNFTAVINERIKDYVERVIWESTTNVGRCQPLAYIYYQGVHFVCARLVDPINAFWLATIICAMLLLPILFVCHRLMCLYLRIYPAPVFDAAGGVVGGCPFCTGLPAPVTICQGGQQAYCECPFGARTDQAEGAAPVQTAPQVQRANKSPVTERSKRKND